MRKIILCVLIVSVGLADKINIPKECEGLYQAYVYYSKDKTDPKKIEIARKFKARLDACLVFTGGLNTFKAFRVVPNAQYK